MSDRRFAVRFLSMCLLFPCVVDLVRAGPADCWFQTGQDADLMLSGVDFNNSGGPLMFNHPSGIASDGTRFLMCDRFNNRVLVWNTLPTVWNSPPSVVLGQPDFTSNNPGTSKNALNWPGNVSTANGVVAVADTDNDRILVWTTFPTQNAAPAAVSISLPAIATPGSNLSWPWGVWTDGTRLAAVATFGPAILFWNTLPTTDNQPPSYTVRLPQFGTPRNISTDGATYFFVGDHNQRVTGDRPGTFFWNSFPSRTDQPYDWYYPGEWIKGITLPDGRLTAAGLSSFYVWNTMPTGAAQPANLTVSHPMYKNGDGPDVVYAGGRLYVNNYNGNNVHVYNGVPASPSDQPAFALGSPSVSHNTLENINYIQNPVLATDGTRLIATTDFDRQLWIWNSLPTQSGAAPDVQISLQNQNLMPWDNALFDGRLVVAGNRGVAVWDSLPLGGQQPSRTFQNTIGNVAFQDLKGVALDGQNFYLAERAGTILVWNGLPSTGLENPYRTITAPGNQLNHLNSDGTYLCAAVQSNPAAVYIYRVEDIVAGGAIAPFKSIVSTQQLRLNLPAEALTFDGALAIANTSNNGIHLWRDINDAPDPSKVVVLGQSFLDGDKPAIGINRLFMPASLAQFGKHLWAGEFKFSSRIVQFSMSAPGDVDGDCDVDSVDQSLLIAVLLGQDTDPQRISRSDLNRDGAANGADIRSFVSTRTGL